MLEKTPTWAGKTFCPSQKQLSQVSTQGQVGWTLEGCATWAVMLRFYHRLNVSPNSSAEVLTLNVIILEDEAFGK